MTTLTHAGPTRRPEPTRPQLLGALAVLAVAAQRLLSHPLANGNLTPRGYHVLFILDDARVPRGRRRRLDPTRMGA